MLSFLVVVGCLHLVHPYSFSDYDLSSLKRSTFLFSSYVSFIHFLFSFRSDDPYSVNITARNTEFVFNVYDIITAYEDAILSASDDCVAAFYNASVLTCYGDNSTASTVFSADGQTISSTCIHSHFSLHLLFSLFFRYPFINTKFHTDIKVC